MQPRGFSSSRIVRRFRRPAFQGDGPRSCLRLAVFGHRGAARQYRPSRTRCARRQRLRPTSLRHRTIFNRSRSSPRCRTRRDGRAADDSAVLCRRGTATRSGASSCLLLGCHAMCVSRLLARGDRGSVSVRAASGWPTSFFERGLSETQRRCCTRMSRNSAASRGSYQFSLRLQPNDTILSFI